MIVFGYSCGNVNPCLLLIAPEANSIPHAVANHDSTLIQTPASAAEPAALKGYLNKFVNMAKGHQPRWFILDNGVLSCMQHRRASELF